MILEPQQLPLKNAEFPEGVLNANWFSLFNAVSFQMFLGALGIHRFYIGKIGTGLLWLFTGGLCGIGWLYDFCTLNDQIDERNHWAAGAGGDGR